MRTTLTPGDDVAGLLKRGQLAGELEVEAYAAATNKPDDPARRQRPRSRA